MLELLAPAGSREAVTAAVQNGADAVYLGFGDYNARRNAKNFTREQLLETVEYCHVRGAKVYLTLNTLLSDGELSGAAEDVRFASDAGVDAVLVQDLGVAGMVRRAAPDLPLHASTQMSVMNLDGVRQCADLGCVRAVLARELPADQIAHICAHSPIEIEVFVHGAQCMCYSGQCFFSSVVGTRSGNRGLCAQPCRLRYGWGDRADRALLSLKDMSLAGHLRELEEMGVACAKIEGRMKRPEYVAVVTGIYARALREGREPTGDELEQLRQAFSRQGFTDGYFADRTGRHMFGTRQEEQEPKALFDAARADYGRERSRVPLTADLTMRGDAPLILRVTDGERTVVAQGEPPQLARNRATTAEEAEGRLAKTGGTPYSFTQIHVDADDGLMVPASQLNALRRDALEQLTALRGAPPVRRRGAFAPSAHAGPVFSAPELTVSLRRGEQLTEALLTRRPAVVYLPLEEAEGCAPRFAGAAALGVELSVTLPRVLWDREIPQVERTLRRLKEMGVTSALVTNLSGIALARRAGLKARGDFGLEVYNSETSQALEELGLASVTLSFEQRLSRIRDQRKPLPAEALVYGRLPLMITENCIYRARDGKCRRGCEGEQAIIDRKQARFPVLRAYGCRNEIFNSLPLWLADRDDWRRAGLWAGRLQFTVETPEACVSILDAYRAGGGPAPERYTRGLYYRDVE
ncbi:MAG: U32 family peptidase [Oscillospiraceae bacterium]|nr:U32 family peptidase [Oscillospiraceae bacterium]